MRPVLKLSALLLLLGVLFHLSCNKELPCENCKDNKPPIANAGTDQKITLPKDSVLLDGASSSDPDGTIVKYKWIKVSGPVSSNILKTDSSKTLVKTLVMGIYKFELTVTDNGGLTAKDTMQVIVNDPAVNQPPIAKAGTDQTIALPTDSVALNGTLSSDPDGTIVSYQWTKISGPSSFNIANGNAVQTKVNSLVQGTYEFELKVTDNGGLFSKDTMEVTVGCNIAGRLTNNASFTSSIQLPEPRYGVAFATAGNKIIIAGGYTSYTGGSPSNFSDRVDIYDVTTGQWTITHLSEPRVVNAVAVLGNRIFFAGPTTTVDIYDVSANTWSIAQLSQARFGMAGGATDTKVFFAGGVGVPSFSSVVDIYDAITNSWSTASLSEARYCISDLEKITATTVGQNTFFAGGSCNSISDCSSNRIDTYNATTTTWSNELYVPANGGVLFAGTAAGNKNYFVTGEYWAGGNIVEIRDEITHTTTSECLSGTLYRAPFKNGNKLIFPVSATPQSASVFKLTQFDIYDLLTNTWSISKLPQPGVDLPWPLYSINNSFIVVNNEAYTINGYSSGGGLLYDKIYKLIL